VVEELEATVEVALKRAERLRQAVFKRAFEGRLVPQDAIGEPAQPSTESSTPVSSVSNDHETWLQQASFLD